MRGDTGRKVIKAVARGEHQRTSETNKVSPGTGEGSCSPLAPLTRPRALLTASAGLPRHSPKPTLKTTQIMNISSLWIPHVTRVPSLEDQCVQWEGQSLTTALRGQRYHLLLYGWGHLTFRGLSKVSNVTQLRSIRTGSYSRSDLKVHSSFISATTHATLAKTFHLFGPQFPHL